MRVLTYNIHKGIGGGDRRYRLERIVAVLKAQQPDLICLQEVDQHVQRTHYHDQPLMLAEALEAGAHLYQLNVPIRSGGYGNLILSRWPFRVSHQISLRQGWRKPRGAQMVVVETPQGPLHLVNWHLGLSEQERRWQTGHLLTHPTFHTSLGHPTLITGDFNDWRNMLGQVHFEQHHFRQVTDPTRQFRSFPAWFTLASLDKVFIRGGIRVTSCTVIRDRLTRSASDHLPVVCDFDLIHADG